MKEAKCIQSIKLPREGGGFLRFDRGTVYDVSEIDTATIKRFFESPELAPPKMSTRTQKSKG